MSVIRKTTFVFTVLHPADEPVDDRPFEDVLEESRDGGWIGTFTSISTQDVPDHKVRDELRAVGNDGTFFNDTLDEAPVGCGGSDCDVRVDGAGDSSCGVCGIAWGSPEAVAAGEAMSLDEAVRLSRAARRDSFLRALVQTGEAA